MTFRQLDDGELITAHGIIAAATEWLNSRGIVQWRRVLPWDTYLERQQRGENYGLFEPDLTAVVTLAARVPDYWNDLGFERPFLWLSTLASVRTARGAGIRAVAAAVDYAAQTGCASLYLDCVDRDDALPSLYRGAGFALRERREVWPGWPMCLFAKALGGQATLGGGPEALNLRSLCANLTP